MFALLDGLVEPSNWADELDAGLCHAHQMVARPAEEPSHAARPWHCGSSFGKIFSDHSLVDETNEVIEQWFFKMRKQYPPDNGRLETEFSGGCGGCWPISAFRRLSRI